MIVIKRKNHGGSEDKKIKMKPKAKHSDHISYSKMPKWMGDNEYILSHHRPVLNSFRECFRSIFGIHSETGNIWTHLLGLIGFFIFAIFFFIKPFCDSCGSHVSGIHKLIFSCFFIGVFICFSFSMLFHTVLCHSERVYKIFSKADYIGISTLILGSFIPWIYYGFYCSLLYKIVYISIISVLSTITIFITMIDRFATASYRPIRAVLFVCLGLFGIFPFTHFLILHGWEEARDLASVHHMVLMAVLYISGALLYGARIPERLFPGKCDLWFQSHQIFHTLVVCGAVVQYIGIKNAALYRLTEVFLIYLALNVFYRRMNFRLDCVTDCFCSYG